VTADISDAAQVRAYTDGTVERWGRLDVAFNNAGVNLPGVFHEASDEVIDRTLDVNVKGTMYGCRYAIPHMLR
jgi:dihydroanticapsin dehydrogenase